MSTTQAAPILPPPTEQDPRWARLLARDASADGSFYYSVRSTGVYCRPSCAARRPSPAQVRFHATPAEAEAAGFRPCRRCQPDQPPLRQRQAALVAQACRALEAAEEMPDVPELAQSLGLSPSHFHRLFRAVTGLTPGAFFAAGRARRLREELPAARTVTEAIYAAGYGSNSRVYEAADALLGMTPTAWRAGGADAAIRFAIGECSLGSILVARSERGLCAILLGDDPEALLRDLQDRFPRAELIGGDAEFESLVARVVGFVEAPGTGLDLPLDLRGTAFQQRVWQALRQIPPGSTASYAGVAASLGQPGAARAVASACAANALAVAIPCHRVVRGDGGLSGYRWGVERKRALLDREAAKG
ncbi:bifunctional DNA-binding transcriptional regulator/O6-methylguanine-DNA methyltransferase Ada [Roseomonas marmotae]|uniref:Bifunctional DNA-binding transcriptional regulator/O6-methylguanine-DNA methyltransferase Ada n=1 Tax=Roseomonas marmotae TaxID=2768161 RepID=A0ABS3K812_9PROT|nr:bifunctional DNA-binding transcriptional regulator/O6-methylguanine-DNA methyltransferase Ada [Roseomonas marmotae]MBO1073609.1 bifunctional DNA-binding transcriptional regulator/O6-methylguanine-DNA methyltransferase Ada [Roseomonas marmotae]QTI80210.1 bifunctional DNA-binding transcriptional regulator/O6-methylguanine-DNA methyltransferase Ada [Roseomonas marmotae]